MKGPGATARCLSRGGARSFTGRARRTPASGTGGTTRPARRWRGRPIPGPPRPEAASSRSGSASAASRGGQAGFPALSGRLFLYHELAVDVGRVELAFDVEDSGLVGRELHRLRLSAVHHGLHPEIGYRKAVVRRVGRDVIEDGDLHLIALFHHEGRWDEQLGPLVLDVRHGEACAL